MALSHSQCASGGVSGRLLASLYMWLVTSVCCGYECAHDHVQVCVYTLIYNCVCVLCVCVCFVYVCMFCVCVCVFCVCVCVLCMCVCFVCVCVCVVCVCVCVCVFCVCVSV